MAQEEVLTFPLLDWEIKTFQGNLVLIVRYLPDEAPPEQDDAIARRFALIMPPAKAARFGKEIGAAAVELGTVPGSRQ